LSTEAHTTQCLQEIIFPINLLHHIVSNTNTTSKANGNKHGLAHICCGLLDGKQSACGLLDGKKGINILTNAQFQTRVVPNSTIGGQMDVSTTQVGHMKKKRRTHV